MLGEYKDHTFLDHDTAGFTLVMSICALCLLVGAAFGRVSDHIDRLDGDIAALQQQQQQQQQQARHTRRRVDACSQTSPHSPCRPTPTSVCYAVRHLVRHPHVCHRPVPDALEAHEH